MSIQIKLKNSVVQDSTPSTSDLPEVGELAVNANINSIGGFMRASDNTIVKIFGPGSVTTPTATTTVPGISELATNSETTTGTATNRVVTPAGLNAVTVAERTTSNTNYVAKAGSTMTGVLTATAGSNSAPAINFGDSDSGIFGGTNTVSLAAGGTTRLTADTGVDVTGTLTVNGAITSTSDLTIADKIIHAGDTDTAIRFAAANTISVENAGTESARFDSAGRLLIGTSTFIRVGASSLPKVQVCGTSENAAITLSRYTADNSPSRLSLGKARGATVGTMTVVQDDDGLGEIVFCGADGTDLHSKAASIVGEVDGTPGANDLPGRLVFRTTADGAASPTTRLTIDSAGLVKLPDNGKFVAGAGSDLQIYHDGSNSYIKDDGAGAVILQTNKLEIKNTAAGEDLAKFTQNAAVELYYDNSKKFETLTNGVQVTGSAIVDGTGTQTTTVTVKNGTDTDGTKLGHSSNSDRGFIQVTESGADFGIQVGGANTSNMRFEAFGDSSTATRICNGTEEMITAAPNGAVNLYYDNSKKFETTSSGVSSTGSITAVGAVLNGDVQFTGDNYNIRWDKSEDTLEFLDDAILAFGNSDDFTIKHVSSDSTTRLIETSGGSLFVQAGNFVVTNPAGNEFMINGAPNGAVNLYYDNSKKFETTSAGIDVNGTVTADDIITAGALLHEGDTNTLVHFSAADTIELKTGGSSRLSVTNTGLALTGGFLNANGNRIILGDSSGSTDDRLVFGNNNDLQIYHDGSHSYIDNNTGSLRIRDAGGAEKFRVSGTGTSFNDDIFMSNDNDKINLGASNDLQIFHSGSHSQIVHSGTGNVFLDSIGGSVNLRAGNNAGGVHSSVVCNLDAGVELYFNNSKKFETTADGISVTGKIMPSANNTHNIGSASLRFVNLFMSNAIDMGDGATVQFGDGDDLKIYHDGSSSYIADNSDQLYIRANAAIKFENDAGTATFAKFHEGGNCELYHNNSKKFETTSKGIKIEGGQANGELGIFHATGSTFQSCTLQCLASRNTTNHTYLHFKCTISGVADKMHVRDSGDVRNTNNSYGSISDISLKENIVDAGSQWDDIKNIRVRKFNFKSLTDPDQKTMLGVVAQEAELVCPGLVDTEVSLQEGEEKEYKSFKYSVLYMKAIKCLQEAMAKIEVLEAKVATLEGA